MPPQLIVDPATIATDRVLFDLDAIRRHNPQRFEMEQLTAVVDLDTAKGLIVGYLDVGTDEFWIRGHLPDYPLMPGVLVCEAAAQLCGFYCHRAGLVGDGFLGFGGMEEVRFRSPIRPGDRLVIVGKAEKIRPRQQVFQVQGFVGTNMVFHGKVIGVPIPRSDPNP